MLEQVLGWVEARGSLPVSPRNYLTIGQSQTILRKCGVRSFALPGKEFIPNCNIKWIVILPSLVWFFDNEKVRWGIRW
jgi:hypothetical protein